MKDNHALGYKVLAYNNPYISTSLAPAKSDLDYGKAHGLFALTPEGPIGETFFISGQALSTFRACTKVATRGPRHECGQMLQ